MKPTTARTLAVVLGLLARKHGHRSAPRYSSCVCHRPDSAQPASRSRYGSKNGQCPHLPHSTAQTASPSCFTLLQGAASARSCHNSPFSLSPRDSTLTFDDHVTSALCSCSTPYHDFASQRQPYTTFFLLAPTPSFALCASHPLRVCSSLSFESRCDPIRALAEL